MRVPAEGMEDHDETGSEVHGFILLKKHTGDNAVYGMEKTVEEGAVIEKKVRSCSSMVKTQWR